MLASVRDRTGAPGASGQATTSWMWPNSASPRCEICWAICIIQFVPLFPKVATKTSCSVGT
jgi:hypothetical protein